MKIKPSEWKHVYKKRKERKLKITMSRRERAPIRIVGYLWLERSTIFGLLSEIAPAKLDPCDARPIPRFSDDQKVNLRNRIPPPSSLKRNSQKFYHKGSPIRDIVLSLNTSVVHPVNISRFYYRNVRYSES